MEDSKSVWMQIGKDIDGKAANDYSGNSMSLLANGKSVAISSEEGDGSGQVRVFVAE